MNNPENMTPEERSIEAGVIMDNIEKELNRLSALSGERIWNFHVNPENKPDVMLRASRKRRPPEIPYPRSSAS